MRFASSSTALLLALALAAPAAAQPVEVAPLAAPDLFSTGGRDTGLSGDLWRGASAETLRTVLPMLAKKPLSPAAAALARRVLATGANAPEGAGQDAALAGVRAEALMALGDREAASAILGRMAGVERTPELSRAAAESALLAGDDERACAVSNALMVGREDVYWLRLRAFCQAKAGQTGAAQLTYELAQAQARDAVFGRLMGAKLAGVGDPGAPSSRNGLDYALSRSLGLDPGTPSSVSAPASDTTLPPLDGLLAEAKTASEPKARTRAQGRALIAAALEPQPNPDLRGQIATLAGETKAPAGRRVALAMAAEQKLVGEGALLALWISADAGKAGPAAGDRAEIVRALLAVGLADEARAFAVEGLAAP